MILTSGQLCAQRVDWHLHAVTGASVKRGKSSRSETAVGILDGFPNLNVGFSVIDVHDGSTSDSDGDAKDFNKEALCSGVSPQS